MFPGAHADTTPDKPAVVMAGSGRVVTYRELDAEANRVSHLFRSLGLRPGDHVAFCLENHPRFHARLGRAYAGLYYTAMSSLTTDEMAYIIDDSGAQAFVTSAYKADQAELVGAGRWREDVHAGWRHRRLRAVRGGHRRATETPLDEERTEGRDMLYSSGTTGRPKGIEAPLSGAPIGSADPVHLLLAGLYGGTADTVYPPPRCTTRRRCASPWRSTGWAARRW